MSWFSSKGRDVIGLKQLGNFNNRLGMLAMGFEA